VLDVRRSCILGIVLSFFPLNNGWIIFDCSETQYFIWSPDYIYSLTLFCVFTKYAMLKLCNVFRKYMVTIADYVIHILHVTCAFLFLRLIVRGRISSMVRSLFGLTIASCIHIVHFHTNLWLHHHYYCKGYSSKNSLGGWNATYF